DAPVVCAARAVPRQPGLGVHGTSRLRGDEVEAADVRVGDEDSVAEVGGAEPVRVDVHEQLAAALAAFGEGADLHDLARGPDRDVAIRAVVGVRYDLTAEERSDLTGAGHGCAGRKQRAAGIENHPDLPVSRDHGRLVHEAEEAAI